MSGDRYHQQLATFRQTKDAELREENGWLALAGLFWLTEGDNSFGAGDMNPIVLPAKIGVEVVGVFQRRKDQVRLVNTSHLAIEVNGSVVTEAKLYNDMDGEPSIIRIGEVQMIVLKRGDDYAIRLWDNGRPERTDFVGRTWYPDQDAFRIKARYQRFAQPTAVTIKRTLGDDMDWQLDGELHFTWQNQTQTLLVSERAEGQLSLMFKDQTSGTETYGAGRYLTIDPPQKDGTVRIDFNRAYHPPCAFTDYATCPYPPAQNQVGFKIEAGERFPTSS